MQRRTAILGFLFALAVCAADRFPHIDAEALSGRNVTLPDEVAGSPALIVIGFTHGSNEQVKAWTERAGKEIPAKSVYTLVELESAPRMVRGMIHSSIKGSTPKEIQDRFVLDYHGERELKAAAGYQAGNDAYLVLIDAQGQVVWRVHGQPTDRIAAELKKLFAQYTPNSN
jgi:hypothetical protein